MQAKFLFLKVEKGGQETYSPSNRNQKYTVSLKFALPVLERTKQP